MAKETRTFTIPTTITAEVDPDIPDDVYLWGELVDRVTTAPEAICAEPRYADELAAAHIPPDAKTVAAGHAKPRRRR